MSERTLRNTFIFGSLFFFIILAGMTVDSLRQVTSIRTPQLTDQVVAGKRVWQDKNCNDCHTILGIGGYFAPELTKVMERRGGEWLRLWLKNPKTINKVTTMPDQRLSDRQVEDLVAFFQWVNRIDTNEWPPAPIMVADTNLSGEGLFKERGCSSCHMINGQGASGPGPDLSHVGHQRDRAFLLRWLENPQAEKPATTMPRIPLTELQLKALVDYLIALK